MYVIRNKIEEDGYSVLPAEIFVAT